MCLRPPPRPAAQHWLPGGDEVAGEAFGLVQVPPLAHLARQVATGQVTGGEVVGAEQVGVPGQAQPGQHVGGCLVQVGGGDPDARRGGAEPEPGQLGPQHVPLVPLRLGHREHREQPPVGEPGPLPAEDAVVALGQDRLGGRGQLVPGGPVPAAGAQDLAPLEPGDRRPDRWFIHTEVGEQADQRSDRHPAPFGAGVEAVDGDDQLPRLGGPRFLPRCRARRGCCGRRGWCAGRGVLVPAGCRV